MFFTSESHALVHQTGHTYTTLGKPAGEAGGSSTGTEQPAEDFNVSAGSTDGQSQK